MKILNKCLDSLINESNGIYESICSLLIVNKVIWNISISANFKKSAYWEIRKEEIKRELLIQFNNDEYLVDILIGILQYYFSNNKYISEKYKNIIIENGIICFDKEFFRPIHFLKKLFGDKISDSTLNYYIKRWIRDYYKCPLSVQTLNILSAITASINKKISDPNNIKDGNKPIIKNSIREFTQEELFTYEVSQGHNTNHFNYSEFILDKSLIEDCFIEICRNVGYIIPSTPKFLNNTYKYPNTRNVFNCRIQTRTNFFDIEYLISFLFGLSTNIKGFDTLFGGWGIILPEKFNNNHKGQDNYFSKDLLGARTISIMGECGSGKSLLSLQLAIDVASKGGIAWLILMEQTIEECLYSIESLCAYSNRESFEIVTNLGELAEAFKYKKININRGCLSIQRPSHNQSFEEFLNDISEFTTNLSIENDLQLLIVDPINSFKQKEKNSDENLLNLRNYTVEKIKQLKKIGTNILFVAEGVTQSNKKNDTFSEDNYLAFVENISDTLIQLSVKKEHNYSQRIIEVKKSRLQRELRGQHSFSICSNSGFEINLSTAAISSIIKSHRLLSSQTSIKFGFRELDNIIRKESIYEGDVIVFQGITGTLKTYLGYIFLLVAKFKANSGEPLSIIFDTLNAKETIVNDLRKPLFRKLLDSRKNIEGYYRLDPEKNVRIISLPHGYITPGKIIDTINREIRKALHEGYRVHKVMINSVRQWQLVSPNIYEDNLFTDTLIQTLRGHHTTSLLICGSDENQYSNVRESNSKYNDSIIENSDCYIKFDRVDFRGISRAILKVIKTRGMNHRMETFEIKKSDDSIKIEPTSPLLRYDQTLNTLQPVKIRMFFHFDSDVQRQYYETITKTIKAVISQDTEIDYQDRLYLNKTIQIGKNSAIDELQIVQLDEFQYAMHALNPKADYQPLYRFEQEQFIESYWDDIPENLLLPIKKLKETKNNSIYAVPFIQNISFLAYKNGISEDSLTDWEKLAEECRNWELVASLIDKECESNSLEQKEPEENLNLFFAFSGNTIENYNSLFLEILLPLFKKDYITDINNCPLESIFKSQKSFQAGRLLRQLAFRYVNVFKNGTGQFISPPAVSVTEIIPDPIPIKAKVWRHWYTTYNQMISDFIYFKKEKEISEIRITSLPGNISIAGEWYLGIPAYSAAPEAGLELIKNLVSHEEQLNRVRMGVGLPINKKFYSSNSDKQVLISSNFSTKKSFIEQTIENSFRRSTFSCYTYVSRILAYHLKRVIQIPEPDDTKILNDYELYKDYINGEVEKIFVELQDRLDFVQNGEFIPCGLNKNNNIECRRCKRRFNYFMNRNGFKK